MGWDCDSGMRRCQSVPKVKRDFGTTLAPPLSRALGHPIPLTELAASQRAKEAPQREGPPHPGWVRLPPILAQAQRRILLALLWF